MTVNRAAGSDAVEQVLGDVSGLAAQIGSPGGLAALKLENGGRIFQPVTDAPALRRFLRDYQVRIMGAIELPTIRRAFHHAGRSEARELIELDQRISLEPLLESFATASRQVGKTQIKRLRPLRDQRVLQRYLAAVQSGEAQGWHTVVFGLILSLYSMPLRPGLLTFAEQTTRGFVHSAARPLDLAELEYQEIISDTLREVPEVVDAVLRDEAGSDRVLAVT